MVLRQEVLLIDIPFHAIRRDMVPRAPELGQSKLIVGIHQGDNRRIQLGFTDVALVDPGDLFAIEAWERTCELGGTEVAAVTEGSGEVAFAGLDQLGLKAGQWTKVAGP